MTACTHAALPFYVRFFIPVKIDVKVSAGKVAGMHPMPRQTTRPNPKCPLTWLRRKAADLSHAVAGTGPHPLPYPSIQLPNQVSRSRNHAGHLTPRFRQPKFSSRHRVASGNTMIMFATTQTVPVYRQAPTFHAEPFEVTVPARPQAAHSRTSVSTCQGHLHEITISLVSCKNRVDRFLPDLDGIRSGRRSTDDEKHAPAHGIASRTAGRGRKRHESAG